TVRELLEDLMGRFPGLRTQLVEDGDIAPFVNVYLEGEDVRTLDGLETEVRPGSTVTLLPAMAGGTSWETFRFPQTPSPGPLRGRAANAAWPVAKQQIAHDLLDLVGNTPLVELRPAGGVR